MTSITLKVNGAEIRASVAGTLTSGMVGIPVTIEYDEAWEGLTKNLVCRCSKSGFDNEEYRSILNVGNTSVVAHEVMQAGKHLWLGVEGYSPDGTLVIPTTWAMCGVIQRGANTGDDLSADPTLPVWGQLQAQIDRIECGSIPPEQMEEIRACAEAAARAAQAAAISAGRAEGAASSAAMSIGPEEPIGENRPLYWLDTSADDAPVQPEEPDVPVEPEEPEKTLTGITAVYTGGSVPVGTAVSALTGVAVTASYSDGSTEAVTGYTLSGTINEGSNTITVTYQGMTATFTVTGVAQSGGEELPDVSAFTLHEPWLTNLAALTGVDVTSANNPPMVAAGTAEANIPIAEYFDSNYDTLYAVYYRPAAGDGYGVATAWNALIQEDYFGETRFGVVGGNIPFSSGVSTIDDNKLFVLNLAKADVVAAIESTEYTAADIIGIRLNIPSGLSKNYNAKSVWMATVPTTEQQQALIAFFENGGAL